MHMTTPLLTAKNLQSVMISAVPVLFTAATIASVLADQLDVHLIDHKKNETDVRFCSAETANFGSTFLFWSMGVVVFAAPANACQPIRPPPYERNDTQHWVALVARDPSPAGGCNFDVKALNAQAAGYRAVLVYNYEESLLTMQPSTAGGEVRIAAAMVAHSCGLALRNSYAYAAAGDRFSLSFEVPFPFDFQIYVISFAVIIGICLMLSLLVWGIKLYRDWRRNRRNRLPRSSLRKLKVKKFEKGTDPYDCCAICLDDFETGEKLRILPCNHGIATYHAMTASSSVWRLERIEFLLKVCVKNAVQCPAYHTKCVDQWLLKSRSTCPVCKRRVFPSSAGGESDSDEDAAAGGGGGGGAVVAAASGDAAAATAEGGTGDVVAPESVDTSLSSLLLLVHDERTPLLSAAAVMPASASPSLSASATTAISVTDGDCDGTFDNAALDVSTIDDETDDAESVDSVTDAAASPAMKAAAATATVEVFVHRSQDDPAASGNAAEV